MTTRKILITGATGKQGSGTIEALLKTNADFEIVALTRNAESTSAQRLTQKSSKIKVITGNLDNLEAVFQKAKETSTLPIWGVFSVQVAMGDGQNVQSEERQGKALVDIALANKVSHFVYTSVDRGGNEKSKSNPTYVPHFASKHNIEQHLFNKAKGSDMTWTVLRPVAFMDNLTPDFFGKHFSTSWQIMLGNAKKLQVVATSDIGFFAAQAFANPQAELYKNQSISLAGDELSFDEFKNAFESATGKTLPTTFGFVSRIVNFLVKELGTMYRWFKEEGYGADIARLRQINPEMKDLRKWIQTESAWAA